jgi:hypothetical protein
MYEQRVRDVMGNSVRPLTAREIVAHVELLAGGVSIYEVQRAINRLVESGELIEDDSFRYSVRRK